MNDENRPAPATWRGPDRSNLIQAVISSVLIVAIYHFLAKTWWLTVPLAVLGVWRLVLALQAMRARQDANDAHTKVRSIFFMPTVVGLVPALVLLAIAETFTATGP